MSRKRGSIALARSLCYQINGAADDNDDIDGGGYGSVDIAEILSAEVVRLQAVLAQPVQEPVAWAVQGITQMIRGEFAELDAKSKARRIGGTCVAYPLYTTPPKRQWQGLTVWFDGEKVVTQNIPELDIYKRHWNIDACKEYVKQLRDKTRANTAEHAAEAIEFLLTECDALHKEIALMASL